MAEDDDARMELLETKGESRRRLLIANCLTGLISSVCDLHFSNLQYSVQYSQKAILL